MPTRIETELLAHRTVAEVVQANARFLLWGRFGIRVISCHIEGVVEQPCAEGPGQIALILLSNQSSAEKERFPDRLTHASEPRPVHPGQSLETQCRKQSPNTC